MRKINKEHIISINSIDKSVHIKYFHLPFKKGGPCKKDREEGLYYEVYNYYTLNKILHKLDLDNYKDEKYLIEGNKIYSAPCVKINLLDCGAKYVYFTTIEEANSYIKNFKQQNLIEI